MTKVIFRKASARGTTGIWLAHIRKDLREFCPTAYGSGIHVFDKKLRDFGIRTIAINLLGYSLQIFREI